MNSVLEQGLAIRRIVGVSGFVIIGTGFLLCTLRRKHSELEDGFGISSGRRMEVIFCLTILYLGVAAGLWRILGDFFGILLFDNPVLGLSVASSLFVQTVVLALGRRTNVKSLRDCPQTY